MSLEAVKSDNPKVDAHGAADELLALSDVLLLVNERDSAPLDDTIEELARMICERAQIVHTAIQDQTN